MPDKKQTLSELQMLISSGEVSKKEVLDLFPESSKHKKLTVSEILYYIGGSIILLGIVILVWQNWDSFSQVTKILVTLGSAVASYLIGFALSNDKRTNNIAPVFYLLSAALAPLGLHTLLDSQGIDASSSLAQSLISSALFTLYIISFTARKRQLFLAISIIFATWLYFAFTTYIIGPSPLTRDLHLDEYRVLIAGISYLGLGHYLSQTNKKSFTGFLYFFGGNAVLLSTIILGGWSPNQNFVWETIYPIIVFVFIFGSVYLRSTALLGLGTIYLMIYIIKITSEYFAQVIGWPLALVFIGFILILIGGMSVNLKRKYLNPSKTLNEKGAAA